MNEFQYCTSTTIIFGKNAENQTAQTIKVRAAAAYS